MTVIHSLYLVLILVLCLQGGDCRINKHRRPNQISMDQSIEYNTKSKDIIIPVMMHLDKAMTSQVPKLPVSKRINFKPKKILQEVEKLFNTGSLNQKVRLKLVNLKVINNSTGVLREDNVSKYLKSYCEWQKKKKVESMDWYFSVLLTGLDIYYINTKGQKVIGSTGRGYMSKMCSLDKSCAVVKWHPKDVVHLLAHEIAHSLGVYHDGTKNHCQSYGFVMASQYNRWRPPKFWSTCSRAHLRKFMSNKSKSWCVFSEKDVRI